ncbi:MAG: MarR family winged helix-turn-helix transcriptional regulator [Pseudomonadales bacterium]|nr:MarR family winged helix-turn-helix transcriptional regulator [Pseudomonadales bacterium]NRA18259.1 winged helix-turn-helix transcriptional regulator [Oceanospirillaceae bacterium]
MNIDTNLVIQIQAHYPKIYFACHSEHNSSRSSASGLSNRDMSILAHLYDGQLTYNKALAAHLKVAPSTMSEALNNLVALQMLVVSVDAEDERKSHYRLSVLGEKALQDSSVLDTQKLQRLLNKLSATQQQQVVEGLRLLADAARQ